MTLEELLKKNALIRAKREEEAAKKEAEEKEKEMEAEKQAMESKKGKKKTKTAEKAAEDILVDEAIEAPENREYMVIEDTEKSDED